MEAALDVTFGVAELHSLVSEQQVRQLSNEPHLHRLKVVALLSRAAYRAVLDVVAEDLPDLRELVVVGQPHWPPEFLDGILTAFCSRDSFGDDSFVDIQGTSLPSRRFYHQLVANFRMDGVEIRLPSLPGRRLLGVYFGFYAHTILLVADLATLQDVHETLRAVTEVKELAGSVGGEVDAAAFIASALSSYLTTPNRLNLHYCDLEDGRSDLYDVLVAMAAAGPWLEEVQWECALGGMDKRPPPNHSLKKLKFQSTMLIPGALATLQHFFGLESLTISDPWISDEHRALDWSLEAVLFNNKNTLEI